MTAFVGWLGSALAIALFFPQLLRTWRYGTAGTSFVTPMMGAFCQATWCLYGILRRDLALTVCNAVSCAFACGILVRFALDARQRTHFSQTEADRLLDTPDGVVTLEV